VRLYPTLVGLLPRHRPRLAPAMPEDLVHACPAPVEEGR
jgi:hypothetical protein